MHDEHQPQVIRRPLLDGAHVPDVAREIMQSPDVALSEFRPGMALFDTHRREADQRELYFQAMRAAEGRQHITPATEWLIDNHHVVTEAYRHLHRDLDNKFLKQLPKVTVRGGQQVPRVLALGWEYVALTDSDLRPASLNALVSAAQDHDSLTIGELWALPSMLRYVLLDNMLRLSRRLAQAREDRVAANADVDRLRTGPGVPDTSPALQGPLTPEQFDAAISDTRLRQTPYAAQVIYRLHEGFAGTADLSARLSTRLAALDTSAERILAEEQLRQTSGTITAGNIIRSLRWLDEFDWNDWFEDMSHVETLLRRDPDHVRLSAQTRNMVRTRVEKIARHSERSEIDVAEDIVDWARARGASASSVLLGPLAPDFEGAMGYSSPLAERIQRAARAGGVATFAGPMLLLALGVLAVGWHVIPGGAPLALRLLLLLLLMPAAYEIGRAIVALTIARLLPPLVLPSFGFKGGIPQEYQTLVVIPCMLTGPDTIDDLTGQLESHWLANADTALHFALVTDWADAATETTPRDAELLAHARRQIEALAAKYAHTGRRFYLLHRHRQWNAAEGVWMGWERKRGKLAELNALLRGATDTSFVDTGARPPEGIRYVVTLDSDTRMPRDTVRDLVGMMAHPVNRPVYDAARKRIVSGHGLIQPRVTPSLTIGREASIFQRIYSRDRGLDHYVFAASDLYQDLLDQGTYTGKGIYDVDAFIAAAEDGIRENSVLSHDLIEGAWLRAALASNAQFIEDYPQRFDVDLSRQHRWARGDWQLLPYLADMTNGLDALARYRMADNLRRSLLPATMILSGLIALLALPLHAAVGWLILLALPMGLSQLMDWLSGLVPRQAGVPYWRHLMVMAEDLVAEVTAFVVRVAFLPQMAWSLGDATFRSLWRTFVSGRHMLEWTTADAAARSSAGLAALAWRMRGGLAIALAVTLALVLVAPHNLPLAGGLILLWLLAPILAWATSQPLKYEETVPLTRREQRRLRAEARLTWRFFETFVTADSHHLPPDNYQDDPAPKIATRTSPSNIGLYVLSIVSAREFHWISLTNALDRIEATLTTMGRMERHRGHLLNWYATDTLAPLLPRYVSTVDSGNLAGHLLTLSATLRDWAEAPALAMLPDLGGVADVLEVMRRAHAEAKPERRVLMPLYTRIGERIDGLAQALAKDADEPHLAPVHAQDYAIALRDLRDLIRVMAAEMPGRATDDLAWWADRLVDTCDAETRAGTPDVAALPDLSARMLHLAEAARAFAFEMDFAFLYDRDKRLFTIGYRPAQDEFDKSYYDLLASEARLASFFAIGKGDVPTEHWTRLGRQMVARPYGNTLVSWSGCMFEYLMAPLVMEERPGSILHESAATAIEVQMRTVRWTGRPWGVSESAYNARDADMNYQYFAFGTPDLALRRWQRDDLVVAPYASFLAAPFRPRAALANLDRLARIGARGIYGYFDAVDFTPSRLPEGAGHAVVRNVMAHHSGMSIVAVANCLLNGIHRRRFHADAVIESVASLLQQKAPRAVASITRQPPAVDTGRDMTISGPAVIAIPDAARAAHAVALMSNGQQSLMIDASGAGRQGIGRIDITRWRPDPVSDAYGEFLFLRDPATGTVWSATAAPLFDPEVSYAAEMHDFKARFTVNGHDLSAEIEVIQADDLNARGTRISLRNLSDSQRDIDLISFGEIALDDAESDRAHTAFSRMFVATEVLDDLSGVRARRNPRKPSDPRLHLLHLATGFGTPTGALTDRRRFVGRGRDLATAQALSDPGLFATRATGEDFTMDPAYALSRRLRLRPGKEAIVTLWTVAADSATALEDARAVLSSPEAWERQDRLAWTRSQIQLHQAGIAPAEAALFRRFAALLVYPNRLLARDDREPGAQSLLWAMSVSGDRPIFLIRIDDPADLPIIAQSVRMQEYFRMRGLDTDLVILNEQRASYAAEMDDAINRLCQGMHLINARPHVFNVDASRIDPANVQALLAAATVVVHAQNGPLAEQVDRLADIAPAPVTRTAPVLPVLAPRTAPALPEESLAFWSGRGGFDAEGNYVIRLAHGEATPNPWINVIARSDFGFHIAAEGAAYTWSDNSRDHQLTPWSNDPVTNAPGEGILIRDCVTGALHSPYAALSTQTDAQYECRHGAGWTRFRACSGALDMAVLHTLAPDAPERIVELSVTNTGTSDLPLDIGHFLMPVMGGSRARTAQHLEPVYDRARQMILCRNPWSVDYPDRVMTLSIDQPVTGVCLSRTQWLGRNRSIARPAWYDVSAGGRRVLDTDADPLMMLETWATLKPGETRVVTFRIGAGDQPSACLPALAQAESEAEWDGVFDHLQVETPDPAFDLMVNRWLPYQALACRIRARTAFWQASGAYGFRDQLQDTLAMLVYDPGLARAQLLNAAGRQFAEGDVQHWWLPGSGAGVRTMIADDVVWLGAALARYVAVTGDRDIMEERLPFLTGRGLEPGEHDAFYTPGHTEETATLWDHAARALDLAVARTGAQGLPLFLGGDWNDGMNRVGEHGQGQSVWLGWFLGQTLADMAQLAQDRGDSGRAARWMAHRETLRMALDSAGWDGGWYLRGLYDDGTPLGSQLSEECRIDSIAQSWSVISGLGEPAKTATALDAALAALEDPEGQLIRLFTPPFQHTDKDPGYIKGYPPGVRENGGQYTHAAIWLVQALSLAGRHDDAWRLFATINPVNHATDPASTDRYRGEPYVVAADVYGAGDRLGRAGWTWYTGSAGWLHRVAVEHVLGLTIHDGKTVTVTPGMPSHWPGFTARLRVGGHVHQVRVTRDAHGTPRATVTRLEDRQDHAAQ